MNVDTRSRVRHGSRPLAPTTIREGVLALAAETVARDSSLSQQLALQGLLLSPQRIAPGLALATRTAAAASVSLCLGRGAFVVVPAISVGTFESVATGCVLIGQAGSSPGHINDSKPASIKIQRKKSCPGMTPCGLITDCRFPSSVAGPPTRNETVARRLRQRFPLAAGLLCEGGGARG